MAKLSYTWYLQSMDDYSNIPYSGGTKTISVKAGRPLTQWLTDDEANELKGSMRNCQFVRDNRVPPQSVVEVSTPEVKATVVAPPHQRVEAPAPVTPVPVVEESKSEEVAPTPVEITPAVEVPLPVQVTTAGTGSPIMGVNDAIQKIAEITDIGKVDEFVRGENRGKVKKAAEARKAELSAAR